jgi:glycine/D-amino acid oxidase-like deaminating enzyme
MKHICVVGAGTVGLSVAYKILEELDGKVKVTIIAESFMHQTTSIGSGGLWEPYQISGTPDELVNKWGLVSFNHFLKLYYSVHAKEAGTQLMNAYSLYTEEECLNLNEPSWKDIVFNFKVMTTSEIRRMMLPERFVKAFSFSTIVVDQKYYMQYLTNILKKGGVEFIQRKLNSLDELDHETFDAIVNCTGLGSAKLLDDSEMYPIRGQVLRVKYLFKNSLNIEIRWIHISYYRAPWMKNVMFWEKSYIIPNIDTVVLGGTADKGEWDTSPSLKCTERILNDI